MGLVSEGEAALLLGVLHDRGGDRVGGVDRQVCALLGTEDGVQVEPDGRQVVGVLVVRGGVGGEVLRDVGGSVAVGLIEPTCRLAELRLGPGRLLVSWGTSNLIRWPMPSQNAASDLTPPDVVGGAVRSTALPELPQAPTATPVTTSAHATATSRVATDVMPTRRGCGS